MRYFLGCWLVLGLALPQALRAQRTVVAVPASVSTLAGAAGSKSKLNTDGQGAAASFGWPMGIAVDAASGMVYVTDEENNTIRQISPAGAVSTLAGQPGTKKESADGLGAVARFYHPAGLAVAANGDLYVTDADNNTLRKITPQGSVTTVAGVAGHAGSTDGGLATALFNCPHGVAVAPGGLVYITDTYNHTIRRITPEGRVETLAGLAGKAGSADGKGAEARFSHPSGIAVDASGTVYVADNGNFTVRKITPAGVVTTLAGLARHKGSADGTGAAARFHTPNGIAVDATGTVYVADYVNSVIRQITPRGEVTTFAGIHKGWRSIDGPRAEASFSFPLGVALGANGWLYVTDSNSRTIRVIK